VLKQKYQPFINQKTTSKPTGHQKLSQIFAIIILPSNRTNRTY